MESFRWTVFALLIAHLVKWAQGQELFPGSGYTYQQCEVDVKASDRNRNGFISMDELEYLDLITRVGADLCFTQVEPLGAVQKSAYLTVVCEIVPDCRITSELPVNGLTREQFTKICNETRKIIFSTCPEPTVSPVGNPSPGAPSRAPVLPTSTAAPVLVPTPPIALPTLPTSPQAPPSPTPGLPTVCAAAALLHAAVFLSTTSSMLTTFFLDPCTNKGPNWHICADHTFWRYCEECDFGTVPIRLGSC